MQASAIGALAPVMLLCAAFGSWSIISLFFLLAFFVVQYKSQRRARHVTPRPLLWMSVVLLATGVIVTEGFIELAWAMVGSNWDISESPWLDLIGLSRLNPWEGNLGVFLSLLPQFGVAITAACALYHEQQANGMADNLSWGEEGSQWRGTLRNFLLPAVQIVVGVARPSWIALPYFVCSCVGLLHWSMTSNFVGLSWGWRPLLLCTGCHILLLYLYQLPIAFPDSLSEVASYFGLFKVSAVDFGWPEGLQAAALVALYILLCLAINDLREEHYIRVTSEDVSGPEDSLPRFHSDTISSSSNHISDEGLSERLLPAQLPTSHRDTIQSRRWAGDQRRAVAFQHATINFITYGFPVCLIALVCWSFIYASLCAFGLLLYVGYIFYGFPSVLKLRQLNPVLLVFILSWALSTYVFNAAFTVISEQSAMGMEFWHSIGLWHYSTPGLFIFAQFALGVLVATDIFVSNVIIQSMSETDSPNEDQGLAEEDNEDWKVLILAVIAWCLRRSSYVISLVLIFTVGMKDGLLHAVYIGFFLMYLVSSAVAKRTRQYLILFCELHFAALYLLQLDWISSIIERNEAVLKPIFSQLGLWGKAKFQDFLSIAALLCFLAVQSHGFKVLSSLSATIQQSPQPPLGWGILRVGNRRSVLMSVYASQNFGYLQQESSNNVNWVTKHLAAIAEKVRATYRSFGTYIVYGTVISVICFVEPNYVSLGYLCFLLFWVVGRQITGHTTSYLWYPLMIFSGIVFVTRYILSAFPDLRKFLENWFALNDDFGFNPHDSLFGHLWDSLAILAVMQLFRFERAQVVILAEEADGAGDQFNPHHGYISFFKRFAILHSGKVLTLTVFYASITPVSATGFMYLIMLLVTCNMSKTSRLPGQLYAVYTAILLSSEYLFQLLGQRLEMFPGQSHGNFASWIGFHVYEKGYVGVESGLRSKVLILVACILQYCTFYWLEQLPASLRVDEQYKEPCLLFLPHLRRNRSNYGTYPIAVDPRHEGPQAVQVGPKIARLDDSISDAIPRTPDKVTDISSTARSQGGGIFVASTSKSNMKSLDTGGVKGEQAFADSDRSRMGSPWGSAKESRRWTKRANLLQKQDRYEAQLRTLSIYTKHTLEHFFQLYGLEISMLALLVASFAVLNVISLCYILVLGLCILFKRRSLRIIWPLFVMLFACVLITEYAVLGKGPPSWNVPPILNETEVRCNNCALSSAANYDYCWRCWLGWVVDDRQILVAHFMVFLIASLQLRANMATGGLDSRSFHAAIIPPDDRLAWKEISYETTSQWTWLDHVRFFFYRHLLHVVLLLVFATGTLQYDVLHLGYLTFSLIFFRMRSTIMTKRNSVFMFLRLYNYILIVASLLYQAPYSGFLAGEKCSVNADIYNIVGLYKMKFGFRITARSALVDITIFCVAGLQAHIFRSREFEQVLRYLEAEQVEARAHAQENKAAYKKEHLQRIRETEERKQQRRSQVEKMKTDMLHLQLRLDVLNSTGKFSEVASPMIELDACGGRHPSFVPFTNPDSMVHSAEDTQSSRGLKRITSDLAEPSKYVGPKVVQPIAHSESVGDFQVRRRRRVSWQGPQTEGATSPNSAGKSLRLPGPSAPLRRAATDADGQFETIMDAGEESASLQGTGSPEHNKKFEDQWQKQRLLSGVQLLGDGVAQVQNLGNKALSGIMGFLNIEPEDDTETSSTDEEGKPSAPEKKPNPYEPNPFQTDAPYEDQQADSQAEKQRMIDTWRRISMLCQYFWSQVSSNTDIVCYFFFVIAYTWNFSFLTLVFPATLFLYALLANPGPSQHFWFAMLVYTEINILLQYMYQIHVQNCEVKDVSVWLIKLGIPGSPMEHSFVISVLPLFLVYLATLVQSSIKARDGEWLFVSESHSFPSSRRLLDMEGQTGIHRIPLKDRLWKSVRWITDAGSSVRRGLSRYWQALRTGSEAPPHFVQVSMLVGKWPEDGIQPERIESGINRLLTAVRRSSNVPSCQENENFKDVCSRVRVESIENSPGKPNMALAVLEVIYAAPPRGYTPGAFHHTLTPAADVAAELQRAKDEGLVEETAFAYPIVSVIPGGKREVDLYALIFGTDLIAFLYVALFYQSAMKHSEQLLEVYQVEDQFPKEFVFVLMTLFFLMLVDRVLYLCSFATGKVIYYFFSFALYTAYVSDFVWSVLGAPGTPKHFFQLLPLRGFYLMKALSLALQAVQLKFGLPHKSTLFGQFLTRKVNSTSWLGFRLYRALPFLYELRCVLDWSCTTTALSMYDWLKLEDIYASLYLVQCDIKMVREKHRLGEKQGVWIKFCSGVLLFFTLIGIIWAPMLAYSSGNPTNIINQINDVRARIEVKTAGGKFPIFQTGLCQVPFLEDVLQPDSTPEPFTDPYAFLTSSSYDIRDVQLICCEEDADSLWMIPPPTLKSLMDSIDDDIMFQTRWEFNRDRPKGKEVAAVPSDVIGMNSSLIAQQLRQVLNGTLNSFRIANLYPRYFRIPGSGDVRVLEGTVDPYFDSTWRAGYVSGNLTLNKGVYSWWSFTRDDAFKGDGCGNAKGPVAFTVSEEVPKGIIGETLSKFSIWSLYITFVLAVGRFIRLQCSDIRMRIPFENFPACDRVVAICEDIYAARAERELELEEGLFWTLIKIYRSPHILMEYTKVE
ncbi:piezo-type mechanosensitive ion channel component 1/2 [Marchantia polymorpha subsp. ruderalis]|uniref:Uncharacterized protein n=2 Tax=Marchantia polymorpha TaxID=3197 RepID=A0A2R6XCN6_MARPO|nr:hypothetical protein MARPO_0023s0171 [Marchantia polymorpha]PTQ43880.1 hypothetical protein MARPO_0023s0171 [Marchantia polymorpha]BBN02016.1 hypothetical protein Mp_2g12070 [Marchantia polymorpha subsp. ruderalis]BBN02017.1 hypothetical protein Mp_2g12070 [Marchantia polymorpha subsp. ruderalis]|eukprot:PTQ43879.1 hypothetical protein MARPO_0023s0171 [Marchantia polymorpha]